MKRFTKKALPLAIAVAMTPGFASAAEVSGFADIFYTLQDESSDPAAGATTKNTSEGKFTADAEIDIVASPADGVTVRVDIDLNLAGNGAADGSTSNTPLGGDSGRIEQAFFAWGVTEGVTVLGGVFNNPIGYDAEDAPDMNFSTHDVIYGILDNQTALNGDNVAGLAAAFAVGPATITAALLNETGQANESNSFALVANASPVEGLDLELGFVTQASTEDRTADGMLAPTVVGLGGGESAGNVIDLNGTYSIAGATIGFDYLTADKIVDSAYALWLGYDINDKIGLKVRTESVAFEMTGAKDTTRTTFYASYAVASNLSAALEITDGEVGETDFGVAEGKGATLELIASF